MEPMQWLYFVNYYMKTIVTQGVFALYSTSSAGSSKRWYLQDHFYMNLLASMDEELILSNSDKIIPSSVLLVKCY